MGEVYLAEQVSLDRKVALKVLRRDLTEHPKMGERFRHEALLLSSVEHPAVVRVIDYGHEGASPCLVMEFAEGETLRSVLRRGALPLTRSIPMLCQLLEGLAAIHRRGIIHRDLKPDNVVLSWGPRGEQARLLDFGIARFAWGETGRDAGAWATTNPTEKASAVGGTATDAGVILGTPQYLAPEQAAGNPVDIRTDLYSFGVLAFETLTGELPFRAANPQDFLAAHVTRPPRSILEVAPHLSTHTELCELVMGCLRKDPDARPENATVLLEAIARIEPSAIHTPPGLMRPSDWGRTAAATPPPVSLPPVEVAKPIDGPSTARISARMTQPLPVTEAPVVEDDTQTPPLPTRRGGAATVDAPRRLPPPSWWAGTWRVKVLVALGLMLGFALGQLGLFSAWQQAPDENDAVTETRAAPSRVTSVRPPPAFVQAPPPAVSARTPRAPLRPSTRQWELLRRLDRAGDLTVAELVDAYGVFLEHGNDCATVRAAATRLGQLGTERAVRSLERASDRSDACGALERERALWEIEARGW